MTVIGVAVFPARMIFPHDLVDLAMDRLVEMLGAEEVRDAIEGLVVDQNRAEQRLLRLDVMRREPERFWFIAAASEERLVLPYWVPVRDLLTTSPSPDSANFRCVAAKT